MVSGSLWGSRSWWLGILMSGLFLIGVACTGGETGGDEVACDPSDFPFDDVHQADTPRIDPQLIVVPTGQAADFAAQAGGAFQVVLRDPGQRQIGLVDLLQQYELGRAYDNLFEPGGQGEERWNVIEGQISTFWLEGGNAADVLIAARNAGIEADPVHYVYPSNHFGAYPGVPPEICDIDGWELPSAANTVDRRVGIVDTGFSSGSGLVQGAAQDRDPSEVDGGDDCSVSHGEFVASVIRQVDPSVQMVGRRGFWHNPNGGWYCWLSNELVLRAAILDLPLDKLSALNLSLGSLIHEDDSGETYATRTFEAVVDVVAEIPDGPVVYAAAGNAYAPEEIYPAALPGVVAVAALAPDESWLRWDTTSSGGVESFVAKTTPIAKVPDWIDVVAAGCELVGTGVGGGQVAVWSGSSFATPVAVAERVAAGAGGPTILGYEAIPGALHADGATDPSHCPDGP